MKGEGEECGGSYGLKGRCSSSLACYSYDEPERKYIFAPYGICGKYNIDKDQNCLLFDYEGCNLVDDFCDCRKETACINPFKYPSEERCARDLHKRKLRNREISGGVIVPVYSNSLLQVLVL